MRWLLISDLQIPYEHPYALIFCQKLVKHFKIPKENILNLGDETDQYWGSLYKKSINASHTAQQELDDSIRLLKDWYKAFPHMKLCESNHGIRWKRKVLDADIPEQMMRDYKHVIQAPQGWHWAKYWKIKSKFPFMIEHGDDWGGQTPHIQAAIHNGISTAIGHHHSRAGIHFIKTSQQSLWGAVGGCLIDFEAYAFDYARKSKFKPCIGTLVVVDDGARCMFIPIESFL